jgi:hypothetical protein
MVANLRHRRVPMRVLGDALIVARPRDGAPVVMESTAAHVWQLLDEWTDSVGIDRGLAEAFPEVAEEERVAARAEILRTLRDDDLIERA